MTEEQVRQMVREQIIENFQKKINESKSSDRAEVMTEAELRIFARSKLREMALKRKIEHEE